MKGDAGFPGQMLGTSLLIGKRAAIQAQGANSRSRERVPHPHLQKSADSTPAASGALCQAEQPSCKTLSFWRLLWALPAFRGGAPPKASSTGFSGSWSLHEPCREQWRKVSLTCLEIFRPGMEAARKIFTLFVLTPQRFGFRESSGKYRRLLPRHQFNNLVRDKRASCWSSLNWNSMFPVY